MATTAETELPAMQAPTSQTEVFAAEQAPTAIPDILSESGVELELGIKPAQTPPSEAQLAAAEEAGIAAWHNSKKITALWSNASTRNAYIAVDGMGWKKLANPNDSSFVSMTMMAAHAEQINATVNIRTESDGMVHEIYVW